MDKIIVLLFSVLIALSLVNAYQINVLSKLAKTIQPTTLQNADETYDKRELTSYELERLEREEEFDSRISRLKDELSVQQRVLYRGIPAEELHPLVHNLPHDTVQTKYDVLPDVEVAD